MKRLNEDVHLGDKETLKDVIVPSNVVVHGHGSRISVITCRFEKRK